MRISDWSSDVCSSDLDELELRQPFDQRGGEAGALAHGDGDVEIGQRLRRRILVREGFGEGGHLDLALEPVPVRQFARHVQIVVEDRSEEHTSELQSLMRSSYAVFCLQKKINQLVNLARQSINAHHANPHTYTH